ncbi:MAG: anaerobic ribonucleoside-triphosphate reductase activating protein [Deltaproteobacteria bacterium]|nr:anaerobic ribonucleoside-triphosphate reductase activating protein [Deltaproteobacteria bacterium]
MVGQGIAMQDVKDFPIKGFLETSFVDWHGKICSVIVFSRCNFRCRYCHNADLVLRSDALENISFDQILTRLEELKGWVDGVCVSGGEPTLHECLPEIMRAIKSAGFLTKLDTNGSNPVVLERLLADGLIDYVAMDVKSCLDEDSYCRITQAPQMLAGVKKSIKMLMGGQVAYEFRCTVVPSVHERDDIYKMAKALNGAKRLRIQNFSPSESLLDPALKVVKPFSEQDIDAMQSRVDKLIAQ